MKKLLTYLVLSALVGAAQLPIHAAPTNVCDTACASSCGDCKVVKTNCIDRCECVVSSKTHFSDHIEFYINSPIRESLWRDRVKSTRDRQGAFQAVLFGGQTTERGRMATYFTPFCASELRVKEDMAGVTDAIGAGYFNVDTVNGDFESIIRFAPEQSLVGLGLSVKQRFLERESGKAFIFEASAPLMRVRNTMNFSEEVINDGGGVTTAAGSTGIAVANMQQAFKQAAWECGKIDCCCDMTKTRLAFLELVLGYETLNFDCCRMESYAGVILPTGNSVDSTYLFEPVVGYGKHTGVMFGSTADLQLWADETETREIWYHFHMNGLYLGEKNENRLVDVVNKPWSRFMRVYADKDQAQEAFDNNDPFISTPGVNVFCRDVNVKPGFQRSYASTFVFMRDGLSSEVGYTFFGRPAECVELACPWEETVAFVSYDAVAGATDRVQQINNTFGSANASNTIDPVDPLALYDDNIISACDLDLRSAAHPAVSTHTIHAAVGYRWDERCYPGFLGLGGSYELSRDNTGADRWNMWAKGGLSW